MTARDGTPTFSILVPCYNVERYINECIGSVEAQTFDDWEIVAINDGSTDATGSLLDEAAQRLVGRLRVVHTSNNGLLLARREAFRRARGVYLICLDADDTLRSDALSLVYDTAGRHPNSLVQFRLSRQLDFSDDIGPARPASIPADSSVDITVYRRLVCNTSSNLNNLCAKAIPSAFVDVDADYRPYREVSNAEDLLQLLPILDIATKAVFIDEALYYYRPNASSITQTFNESFFESVRVVNERLRAHAATWNDDACVHLAETRWLKVVYIACMQLVSSGYSFERIKEELGVLASDADFRRLWEGHKNELSLPVRLFLGDLYAGRFTQPAARICLHRGVRRMAGQALARIRR